MDMSTTNLIIRQMEQGEEKTILKVGRKAFKSIEALFLPNPKTAMVAVYEGKIVGSIIYKPMNTKNKKIVYIEDAFVHPDYHGMGIGKKLYAETFKYLRNQGYEGITALVKDDNVGSWKLFVDNGFKRVSLREIVKELGIVGAIKQYILTPFCMAVGMDFYLFTESEEVKEKAKGFSQALAFFLGNILLMLPCWIQLYSNSEKQLQFFLPAYLTVLLLYCLPRYMGGMLSKRKWHFRLNNGGSFLTILLSIWCSMFPMNANWYPDTYENTKAFNKELAFPEMIKWGLFSLLALLKLTGVPYFQAVGNICYSLLLFLIIPMYPFEAYGAGRIARYNKKLWLLTAIITIIELVLFAIF